MPLFKSARCPHCEADLPRMSSPERCPNCAGDLTDPPPVVPPAERPVSTRNRWQRDPSMVAQRIDAPDLNRQLKTGLVIEHDTLALVFQDGAFVRPPISGGTYSFPTAKSNPWWKLWANVRLDQAASVVLVAQGVMAMAVSFDQGVTSEGVPVRADLLLGVQVGDPMAVFQNLMHGRPSVTVDDFADQVRDKLGAIVAGQVRQATLEQLAGDPAMHDRLERELRQWAVPVLRTMGMELVEIRAFRFEPIGEQYRHLLAAQGERYALSQAVEDLEKRYAHETRAARLEAQRRADARQRAAREHEEAERLAFEQAGATGRRTAELEDLDRARADRLAREQQERDAGSAAWDRAERARALQDKLATHGTLKTHERADAVAGAVGEADVRTVQRSVEEADSLSRQAELERKLELANRANAARLAADHEAKTLEQQRADAAARLAQRSADAEARRELDRIRALSEVEQARLAADLQKTEALKDFSEGQILALMAKDSPQVAAALGEKFRAEAATRQGGEVQALYERVLAATAADKEQSQRFMGTVLETLSRTMGDGRARDRAQADEIKAMAGDAMDRMAGVATAGAAGRPAVPPPPVAAPARRCPRCGQPSDNPDLCEACGMVL
jgi:hypothetical protein